MKENLFFSIIIPAHNEENYIGTTLEHLGRLDYPKDKYEVIVIENGSTDQTLAKAKEYANEQIWVYQVSQKGVSRAKNFGFSKVNSKTDWVIFLDADTVIKEKFLKELDEHLRGDHAQNYAIGTTAILPHQDESRRAAYWFAFYNQIHRFTRSSYSLQVVRHSVMKNIEFNEFLETGEDLKLIEDARKHGTFFYMHTEHVFTSVRRFEQVGWVTLFFQWTFVAILPKKIQQRFPYEAIR